MKKEKSKWGKEVKRFDLPPEVKDDLWKFNTHLNALCAMRTYPNRVDLPPKLIIFINNLGKLFEQIKWTFGHLAVDGYLNDMEAQKLTSIRHDLDDFLEKQYKKQHEYYFTSKYRGRSEYP